MRSKPPSTAGTHGRTRRKSTSQAANGTATAQANPMIPALALYASDLEYLEDELRWIELRARRLATSPRLRSPGRSGEPGSGREDDDDGPAATRRRSALRTRFRNKESRLRARIDERLAAHAAAERPLALDGLCATFGLDPFERTTLLLAAAPCFSSHFDDLFSEMGGEELGYGLTVQHVLTFVEASFVERIERRAAFGRRSRLVGNDLLGTHVLGRQRAPKDLLQTDLVLGQITFGHLLGRPELAEELMEFSSVEEPRASLEQVVLAGEDRDRVLSVVERHGRYLELRRRWGFDSVIRYGRGALMLFHGRPGTGKTMMAHAVAGRLGKRVLTVDVPTFLESQEAARFLPRLFREARLQNALLLFDECEVLFGSRRQGNLLMTALLRARDEYAHMRRRGGAPLPAPSMC